VNLVAKAKVKAQEAVADRLLGWDSSDANQTRIIERLVCLEVLEDSGLEERRDIQRFDFDIGEACSNVEVARDDVESPCYVKEDWSLKTK